jgi:predicted dehydrogenase
MSTPAGNSPVRIGVIGAGLMGREVASVIGRWFALQNLPIRPELVAVCDVQPQLLDWFRQVPTVRHFLTDVPRPREAFGC